jgi:hypothetical protein
MGLPATRDFHFSIDRGGTFTDVFAQVGLSAAYWVRRWRIEILVLTPG